MVYKKNTEPVSNWAVRNIAHWKRCHTDRDIARVGDCGNLSSRRGSVINLLLQLRADHSINWIPYLANSLTLPPRQFISQFTSCRAATNTRPDIFIIAKTLSCRLYLMSTCHCKKTIHLLDYSTKWNYEALDREAVDTEINAFVATALKNLNKDFFEQ